MVGKAGLTLEGESLHVAIEWKALLSSFDRRHHGSQPHLAQSFMGFREPYEFCFPNQFGQRSMGCKGRRVTTISCSEFETVRERFVIGPVNRFGQRSMGCKGRRVSTTLYPEFETVRKAIRVLLPQPVEGMECILLPQNVPNRERDLSHSPNRFRQQFTPYPRYIYEGAIGSWGERNRIGDPYTCYNQERLTLRSPN